MANTFNSPIFFLPASPGKKSFVRVPGAICSIEGAPPKIDSVIAFEAVAESFAIYGGAAVVDSVTFNACNFDRLYEDGKLRLKLNSAVTITDDGAGNLTVVGSADGKTTKSKPASSGLLD